MLSSWRNTNCCRRWVTRSLCSEIGELVTNSHARKPRLSTMAGAGTERFVQQQIGHSPQGKVNLYQENKLINFRKAAISSNMSYYFGPVVSKTRWMTTIADSGVLVPDDNTVASTEYVQPQRIKFKRLDKTARNIMNILDRETVEEVKSNREIPDIRPGYIIQLKVEVPENKRRVSVVKGIVIARRNAGLHTTFRLRRSVAGVGVESVYPLYSPNIKEIKVVDKKKVRRAKLYYLRDRMNALKK